MDVTVAICTFGGSEWQQLAHDRAFPSAQALGVPVVEVHADTLHDARNGALDLIDTEHVCYLDADDELEAGYFDHMDQGSADLRAPSVRYVKNRHHASPRVPRVAGHHHQCIADCLEWGNWLVIGTLAPAELIREVGGFRDFPWSEDWDLWVRCWLAGATIEAIPQAVYRAHVRADSRNRGIDPTSRLRAHQAIAAANGLPVPA